MNVSKAPVFPVLFASASFLVYISTLSPTVNFIDSGELITVCNTLGIAHPTGYPLYTLLGRVFSLFPVGTPACRINLLSAIFGSAAVFFLSLAAAALLEGRNRILIHAAALLTAVTLGLSKTLWDVSTQAEVYSLTVFLYSLIVYLALVKWKSGESRFVYLTAFCYGLSFGNHMMSVLLVPSLLYLAIRTRGIFPWKRLPFLLTVASLFLLGISVYLYLPVRSSLSPLLNWGDPSTFERFIAHVSGWQYRVWMFSEGAGAFFARLSEYVPRTAAELTVPGAIVAMIGLIGIFKQSGDELVFLLLMFVTGLMYAVNYDIPDIDPYYLPTFVSIALMAGVGMVHFLDMIIPGRKDKQGKKAANKALCVTAAALSLLCVVSLAGNARLVDKSSNRLAYYFGANFLAGLEPGSFALTKSWDLYSPVIYLQVLEGVRQDVIMVDYELTRRSWYVEAMLKKPIGHSTGAQRAITGFRNAVLSFERGERYDPSVLENRFRAMLGTMLADALLRGSVYLDFRDEPHLAPDCIRVPHLMAYRLSVTGDVNVPPYGTLILDGVRDPDVPKDERTLGILERYTVIAVNRGLFLIDRGRLDEAAESMHFALDLSPGNLTALKGLAYCLLTQGRETEAAVILEEILRLSPTDTWAREALSR